MRLLLDQDVFALTARFVQQLGHEVVTASDMDLTRASDLELVAAA